MSAAAIDTNPADALMEEDTLPGSPQSSPAEKKALRAALAEKRRAQQSVLAARAATEEARLSSLNGVGLSAEAARLNAQTHRQVSAMVHDQLADSQMQWDSTLRASRLLHEKVAQQLQNKAMRRRAQRDVIKRWAVATTDSHRASWAQRMIMCCGCKSGRREPRLLSDRAMGEAATMFNSGNWSEALKAYDHALLMMGQREKKRRAEAHLVRCECLLHLRDYATMEAEADALLRTAGDNWAAYRMRGTARFYLGNTEQAREDYVLALENKCPSDALGSFVGPCTAPTEAAIIADRDQLIEQTGSQRVGLEGIEGTRSEVRDAVEVDIGTH
eukprot:COSAG02_NODE_32_length_50374_cov_46.674013_5_plen_330_part_00